MDIVREINEFYCRMAIQELRACGESAPYLKLSYNSMLYLNVIDLTEDCTVSRLAEALRVSKPAVTLKINELVKRGLVEKEQSRTDKRVFYLKLSPEIQTIFLLYDEVFGKIEEELRQKYSEDQLELFGDILHTISAHDWRSL